MNFFANLLKDDNMIARICALVVACGLWIFVMTDQNPIIERNIEVRLYKDNLSDSMMVFNAPQRVMVKVRGPRTILSDDETSAIHAAVDLKNITEGQQNVPVTVTFSKGEVISVNPKEVSIYADTVSEKQVPVETRIIGAMADDLTVGSSVITPQSVTIRGATHRLDKVNKVVAPIDVTAHTDNFQTESELVAVSDDGYDVPSMKIDPEIVTVKAVMVKQLLTVELPVEVKMSGNLPDGIRVSKTEVTPKTVRITAPPSVLKGLTKISTKAVDVSKLTGSSSVASELELPAKAIPESNTVAVRFSVER